MYDWTFGGSGVGTSKTIITYDDIIFHLHNQNNNITIENFIIDNTSSASTASAIVVDYSDGFELIDCDVKTNQGNTLVMCDCDGVTISGCTFYRSDSYSNAMLYFYDSSNIDMSDCSTSINSTKYCDTILEVKNCSESIYERNKFLTGDGYCYYGIYIHDESTTVEFYCNAIVGECETVAVYDYLDNFSDIAWNSNTINNTDNDAYGYYGFRNSVNCNLSSFTNNIINVNAQNFTAINIQGSLSYWKPSTDFDYNCYYNGYDPSEDFGLIGATTFQNVTGMGSGTGWQYVTQMEGNSISQDPDLGTNGYDLQSTSTYVLNAWYHITDIDYDIDYGEIPENSTNRVSMGCDQYPVVYLSGDSFDTATKTISFGDQSIGPPLPSDQSLTCSFYGVNHLSITSVQIVTDAGGTNAFQLVGWSGPAAGGYSLGTTFGITIGYIANPGTGTHDDDNLRITHSNGVIDEYDIFGQLH